MASAARAHVFPSFRELTYDSVVGFSSKLALSLSLFAFACGPSEPPKMAPANNDGVAANSASEARIAASASPSATPAPAATNDPAAAQPYMTPMNGAAKDAGGGTSSTSTGMNGSGEATGTTSSASTKAGKGAKGKATPAECKQAMDRAIDIMLTDDPRFAGIPPEMMGQLKQQALGQAKAQKGDPCAKGEMTKAQYNCAMSSTTSPAIQACLK